MSESAERQPASNPSSFRKTTAMRTHADHGQFGTPWYASPEVTARVMFELPLLQAGIHERAGTGQWLAEAVATFGLVALIVGTYRSRPTAVPALVGLYISAAYWFTASTSFANPAVTIARALTATFSGIRPLDAPAFILAQLTGALAAATLAGWLFRVATEPAQPS